jgi:hypothetical protein
MRAPWGARWRLEVLDSTLDLFNLYRHRSLLAVSVSHLLPFSRLSLKNLYFLKTKKFPLRDRGPGLNIAEHSLRDVFTDVSKYIGNIYVSLNRVFP